MEASYSDLSLEDKTVSRHTHPSRSFPPATGGGAARGGLKRRGATGCQRDLTGKKTIRGAMGQESVGGQKKGVLGQGGQGGRQGSELRRKQRGPRTEGGGGGGRKEEQNPTNQTTTTFFSNKVPPALAPLVIPSEIDGSWKLTQYIENGSSKDEIVAENYVITRKDGMQEITKDGKPFSKRWFEVDEVKLPKQITFIDTDEPRADSGLGIYQLDGKQMKLAMLVENDARDRPKSFEEKGIVIAIYERLKNK